MVLARPSSLVFAWLCLGCGNAPTDGAAPKPEAPAAKPEAPAAKPEAPAAKPEAPTKPEAPPEPYVPTRALPEIVVAPSATPCAELPGPVAGESEARVALRRHAVALRRLACEPELFGKTTAELRTLLDLPAEAGVELSDLRGARMVLPGEPTVADVAAVLGIETPQLHVTWQAYHPQVSLGTSAATGTFDLWGPGRVWMGVEHEVERYGDDAGEEKILPAPPELRVSTSVSVGMPAAVVTMKPDADAVPLVMAALGQLAARPELLAGQPATVAAALGLEGERFAVTETSSHREGKATRGVSIDPRRTTLPVAALAEALGLQDAKVVNVNREHDVWELEAGGTTEITWKGLVLGINVSSPEGDASTQPVGNVEVRYMSIMPAGA